MSEIDSELLVQEVQELTELFRDDEGFSFLRSLVIDKDLRIEDLMLIGFIEGDDGLEEGVLRFRGGDVYLYRIQQSMEDYLVSWEAVVETSEIEELFMPVKIGLALPFIE
jgi:hypothetical protein